jgi:hypothetical protein
MLCLLHLFFDHLDFIHIFDQTLGAGVIGNDPFPAFLKGYFAPGSPSAARNLYVNKSSLAIYRAPFTDRVQGSDGFIR